MKKKPELSEIFKGLQTRCRPWSIDKKTAKMAGFTKEELTDRTINPAITFCWSMKGKGFGEFTFKNKDGKIYCNNECEDKDFIKMMLWKMVDDCILEDEPFSKRRKKK